MPITLAPLDESTLAAAAAVLAGEHAAVRASRPELPAAYCRPETCAEALSRLCATEQPGQPGPGEAPGSRGPGDLPLPRIPGHKSQPPGYVARAGDRVVAVLAGAAHGRYAAMPGSGVAVDPELADPTPVLGRLYAELARGFLAAGVTRHYLHHVASPALPEALSNLGFTRHWVYAARMVTAQPRSAAVPVRVAEAVDLPAVARLSMIELRHRRSAPIWWPTPDRTLAELTAEHRALHERGAVHLLAALDGADVGLLTVDPTGPDERICGAGTPHIGPTATAPEARGRGVGRALVAAALSWAAERGHRTITVDFDPANLLSRPFWLGAGFHPTGYCVRRVVDGAALPAAGTGMAG